MQLSDSSCRIRPHDCDWRGPLGVEIRRAKLRRSLIRSDGVDSRCLLQRPDQRIVAHHIGFHTLAATSAAMKIHSSTSTEVACRYVLRMTAFVWSLGPSRAITAHVRK